MNQPHFLKVILHICLGTLMLLLGMKAVNMFCDGLVGSLLDILVMFPSLLYIFKYTGASDIIGKHKTFQVLWLSCGIAFIGIMFSSFFIFSPYISGRTDDISLHIEHTWAYNSIREIAEAINGGYLQDKLVALHLGKYEKLFIYYSLMFLFGGFSPFHICIWNVFHVAVCCSLFLLIAQKESLLNDINENLILFICLLMPFFQCSFIYHRDIIGQYAVVLGVYIFISTYKSNFASLLAFLFYAFLFYVFRQPYLLAAIILFLWGMSRRRQGGMSSFFSIIVVLLVGMYLIFTADITTFFKEDMYFDAYGSMYEQRNSSFLQTILRAFVGYFPWTQLFNDSNWSYHLFICLQCALNLSIIWNLYSDNRHRYSELLNNPLTLFGIVIWCVALISSGHVSYFVVGTPFLVFGITRIPLSRVYNLFLKITLFFMATSLLYYAIGLTGAGFLN